MEELRAFPAELAEEVARVCSALCRGTLCRKIRSIFKPFTAARSVTGTPTAAANIPSGKNILAAGCLLNCLLLRKRRVLNRGFGIAFE